MKNTSFLNFDFEDDILLKKLDSSYIDKKGYIATFYKLKTNMKLPDTKNKVLVIAASPHGYGHLYRGEMLRDFLSENNFDVYYLSNNSVNESQSNTCHFSDLKINMESNLLDNDARIGIEQYFKNIKFKHIIIENFPMGKLFLLEGFKILHKIAGKKPNYICAFRDIFSIDDVQDINQTTQILNKYFDKLLVFSDEKFIKLPKLVTEKILIPIKYIGYLEKNYIRQITIFGGGGKYNYEFYERTLNLLSSLNLDKNYIIKLYTGKSLQQDHYNLLVKKFPDFKIMRHTSELLSEISASEITISTFGYNTFVQLNKFNNFNVIVPLPKNHQEQFSRAEKFCQIKDKVTIVLLDSDYEKNLETTLKYSLTKMINRNGFNNLLQELNDIK